MSLIEIIDRMNKVINTLSGLVYKQAEIIAQHDAPGNREIPYSREAEDVRREMDIIEAELRKVL